MTTPVDADARRAGASAAPRVQTVTTAAPARSRDRDARMRVYLVQMLVRTACFVAALFTHGWWQLVFILGAVVLPYVAVVRVNNAGPRAGGGAVRTAQDAPAPRPALPAEPSRPAEPVVLVGDVVEHPQPGGPRALERGSDA